MQRKTVNSLAVQKLIKKKKSHDYNVECAVGNVKSAINFFKSRQHSDSMSAKEEEQLEGSLYRKKSGENSIIDDVSTSFQTIDVNKKSLDKTVR